jgi:hypothetical protein
MKNCKEIEKYLPLYPDNLLSGEDKLALEEHLKSCTECAKTLAQLKETQDLVSHLKEVEPPPWFKQKIMVRVRKEAENKSFVQKWFYPLRIKIPVQIFATVFIAVLAVYIYRAGDEQMKAVMPLSAPAPVAEVPQNQLPDKGGETTEAVTVDAKREKTAVEKNINAEKAVVYDISSGVVSQKKEELKKAQLQRSVASGKNDAAKSMREKVAPDEKADKYASAPAAKSAEVSPSALEKNKDSAVVGFAMKADRVMQAQSTAPKVNVALRVADINEAGAEAQRILAKYGSKNIAKQKQAGKVVLTAELRNQNVNDLMKQLKTIGRTEEIIMPEVNAEEYIVVVIEIFDK